MKIIVTLPLPPIEASPNWGGARIVKHAAVQSYKQIVTALLREQMPHSAPTLPVTVHLEFFLCTKAHLACDAHTQYVILTKSRYFPDDADNARASFKWGQDCITDLGLVPSDSYDYVRVGRTVLHTRRAQHKGKACLVLEIEDSAPMQRVYGNLFDFPYLTDLPMIDD